MINQEKQDRKKQKTSKGTDGGKKKKNLHRFGIWHSINKAKFGIWHNIQKTGFSLIWSSLFWRKWEGVLHCVTVHLIGKNMIYFAHKKKNLISYLSFYTCFNQSSHKNNCNANQAFKHLR